MNNFRIYTIIFSSFALLSSISACKDKPTDQPEFNRSALLSNISDNIISIAYNDLASDLSDLEIAFSTFETSGTENDFNSLRLAYKESYLSWQGAKVFNFGPAMDNGLKRALSLYPTDTAKIENNISTGSYVLGSIDNMDAVGFPSLDYLLYDNTNGTSFNKVIFNSERKAYIGEVITKMKNEAATVQAGWNSYSSTFKASTGTSSTSSVSYLVNEFNKDYELAKNAKLGIPIGTQSLGIARPEYIEAPYSGMSFELLAENMKMLQVLFNGNHYSTGAAGIGFDDYLNHFEDVSGTELTIEINNKFDVIDNNLNQYNSTSLKAAIISQPNDLTDTYNLIQTMVPCIKTDMPGTFGIFITYQDNDGD